MKVVLVSPRSDTPGVLDHVPGRESYPAPLGLLYLGTLLKREFDVELLDGQLHPVSGSKLADEILRHGPRIVGISLNFSSLFGSAKSIARRVKELDPSVKVVFGGNFATFLADELARDDLVDAVFQREAEISFPAYLRAMEREGSPNGVPGIVYREDGAIRRNEFGGYIEDLDSLPFPDYDLLERPESYRTSMVTSRGCGFRCIYCSTRQMWQTWRARSARNVVSEMKEKIAGGRPPQFAFVDDNFVGSRKRVREFVDLLATEGVEARWGFSARIEMLDDEMIALVGKASCKKIFLGIESGSDAVLKRLGRGYSATEVERKVERCLEAGILPIASFMIGMPWETEVDVRKTFDLLQRLNTPLVMLSVFTPLLGTEAYRDPERFGIRIEPHDLDEEKIDSGTVFHSTEHLSSRDIRRLWIEGEGIVASRRRETEEYMRHLGFGAADAI